MLKTKQHTTTTLDVPINYLFMEDKISQVERLSRMQLQRKEADLNDYSLNSAFEELQVALLKACKEELESMQAIASGREE